MTERQWAGREDAAKHAGGVHPNTIDRWRSQGLITGYKVGRRVLYDLNEIDQMIATAAEESH